MYSLKNVENVMMYIDEWQASKYWKVEVRGPSEQ